MQETKTHTALEFSIVKTLSYFDIFHYPLTCEEIFLFLQLKNISISKLHEALNDLCDLNIVYRLNEFYSLRNDPSLAPKRLNRNKEAERFLPIAHAKAQLISRFPFVKSVMASGSLSKKCMDENSDIDFFIVTSGNRVWIVRLLMTLYKKILLGNSHKLFCINYYLDEDHLSLPDQNVFTATELATLIPLTGLPVYSRLQRANASWVSQIFPNFQPSLHSPSEEEPITREKRILEAVLNIFPLQWCERSVMRLTHFRWKKLYRKSMNEHDFNMAFKSEPHVSKAHPRNFQKKIMEKYELQVKKYSHALQLPIL